LQIPKIRQGSYFPSILEPRRRSEQALLGVIQQAYVCGVSTGRVDQLVESLGLRISKSEVSRVCEALDEPVDAFRTRPLEGRYRYLFLDAKVDKVRDGGRVVNKALVIAHGVHETGRREILSIDVGEAETETEAFWTEFLRGLVARGLRLQLAALHGALPARLPRACSQGPARAAGRVDPADLQRREPRAGPRSALGSGRAPRRPARQGRHDARGRRDRHPGLLRVPELAPAQAQVDQPA
jgi:transposase-like protein